MTRGYSLVKAEKDFGSVYGLIRFNKENREITYECRPRYFDLEEGNKAQYKGWPFTFRMEEKNGRKVTDYLPGMRFELARR